MSKQKIDSLTPLRFIACIAIIAFHSRGHFGLPTNIGEPFQLPQSVSFFFVLSGFIMAFVYPNLDKAGAAGKYWLARFARIWPLHLLMFCFYISLLPEFSHYGPLTALANLLLVQSWIPNQAWFFSFNGVSWSIGTECFFYLVFPLLIKNFEKNWPYKLAFSFLLVVIMAQLANGLHAPSYSPDLVSVHGLMYINPLSRLFEFVWGMCMAGFYRKYVANRDASPIVGLGVEVLAIGALCGLSAYTMKIAHWFSRLPYVHEGGRMWIEYCGISVFTCALLVVVMAWGRGPISRLLSTKPLIVLGEMSFSVYLLHRMFLHYYWNHFAPEQGIVPIAIYLAMLLGASYVSWSLIEMPFRQVILHGPASLKRPRKRSFAILAGLLAVFTFLWSGAPLARVDAGTVNALQAAATAPGEAAGAAPTDQVGMQKIGDIAFGEDLRLLASQSKKDESGLTVTLYWQALRRQKINNYIATRLLSQNDKLVRLKDYRQSMREETVEKGECFKNVLFVPSAELPYVDHMAFALVRPTGESPHPRLVGGDRRSVPDGAAISEGMVAVKLSPLSIAGKEAKPAL